MLRFWKGGLVSELWNILMQMFGRRSFFIWIYPWKLKTSFHFLHWALLGTHIYNFCSCISDFDFVFSCTQSLLDLKRLLSSWLLSQDRVKKITPLFIFKSSWASVWLWPSGCKEGEEAEGRRGVVRIKHLADDIRKWMHLGYKPHLNPL